MAIVASLPPPLDSLSGQEVGILSEHMTAVHFPAGACIFKVDTPGDACYIIDRGTVRIDMDRREQQPQSDIDSDSTLAYVEARHMLGELSLLDRLPRSASAYAQTEVQARYITVDGIDQLAHSHPRVALALYTALGREAATKLRKTNERLAEAVFPEGPDPEVDEMVRRADAAQKEIASWPEERIDALLAAMALAVAEKAPELAAAAVEETGVGDVRSKIIKDRLCSLGLYQQLAGQRGRGPVSSNSDTGVTEIASPMGVVFALGPVTNPVSTFIYKAQICVKSRNALIYSPNRRAQRVATTVGDLIQEVLRSQAAPVDLVQCVRSRTSRKQTDDFMSHQGVSFILATGGPSMVKAAYSSGTPAIGVGPGNTPTLICADADLPGTARAIMTSKPFDHGVLCGAEHNLVVISSMRDALSQELECQGAAVLSPKESERFTKTFVRLRAGRFKGTIVGQPAGRLASQAGIERGYPIRLIVVPSAGVTAENPYAREKMAPILSLFTVDDEEEGLQVCHDLLMIDGTGHTAVIHTHNEEMIRRFGDLMPASRILVNTPAVQGMLGLTTGLNIAATLGCGTFGRTSTTDNVTYTNLRNLKRLAIYSPERAAGWENLLPDLG